MKGYGFIQKAIEKQDAAYKLKYAKKQFEYSCERCCSQNILLCNCEHCPIRTAHQRAVAEINSGERKVPQNKVSIHRDRKGHITLVLNYCTNVTININGKEVDIK